MNTVLQVRYPDTAKRRFVNGKRVSMNEYDRLAMKYRKERGGDSHNTSKQLLENVRVFRAKGA